MRKFKTLFLDDALEFLELLDEKTSDKIIYNIDKAEQGNDPKLFKKLTDNIWEFRTKYGNLQYRLLAFWDKRDKEEILVISAHGIVKKTDKVPPKEIAKAENLMKQYFDNQ